METEPTTYRSRLNRYVHDMTSGTSTNQPPDTGAIDVHFFRVLISPDFDPAVFTRLLREWIDHGRGAFDEDPKTDELAGGPSYIRWGYLLGDQTLALLTMACGAKAGLWEVITPGTLGITGEEAADLAGRGFVMTSGLKWPEGNVIA